MSVRAAAASTLPISAIGSSGPSPPPLVEPLSALRTLVDGDDPWPPDVGALDSRRAPPEWPAGRARRGAVAAASAAVASPVGPCLARARWVDAAIAPPPVEPGPPPVPPRPPATPTPPGWTVFVGWPPSAVGTVSTYWPTPEFPGGAILWTRACANGWNGKRNCQRDRYAPHDSGIRSTAPAADRLGETTGARERDAAWRPGLRKSADAAASG